MVGKKDKFAERYRRCRDNLSPALDRVAAFIDQNRIEAMTRSAADLATLIGTSDATVIRTVQALGLDGLPDLRRELAAVIGDENSPVSNLTRTLEDIDKGAEGAMDAILAEQEQAVAAIRTGTARTQMTGALKILHVAHRIAIYGIGPSAHLAGYFAARLRREGRKQLLLNQSGAALADQLLDLEAGDALLMMAYGRSYREAEATLREARRLLIPIVLITDSLDEKLAKLATLIVPVARGQSQRIAHHGATLACLEALLLGLAASDQKTALASLSRLSELREATGEVNRRGTATPRS